MLDLKQLLQNILLLSILTCASATVLAQEGPQLTLQRIKISAGMHQIDTQLAMTPIERQVGLMNRMKACCLCLKSLPNNAFG
jgi:uncharacterized protein